MFPNAFSAATSSPPTYTYAVSDQRQGYAYVFVAIGAGNSAHLKIVLAVPATHTRREESVQAQCRRGYPHV